MKKIQNPCPTKHKKTKKNGLCIACGFNTLRLTNKELRKISNSKNNL